MHNDLIFLLETTQFSYKILIQALGLGEEINFFLKFNLPLGKSQCNGEGERGEGGVGGVKARAMFRRSYFI